MEIAKKKLSENDYDGAKNFINKAQLLGGEADWYKILGVDPLADEEAVKKTYKQLALLLHPDKNKFDGAEGAFKLVLEAWCLLSDKYKKLALLLHPDKNKLNGSEGAFTLVTEVGVCMLSDKFTEMQKQPYPHKPASSGMQKPPNPCCGSDLSLNRLKQMDLQFVTRNVKIECIEANEEGDGETQGTVQGDWEKADAWEEFVPVGTGEDGRGRSSCIHWGKVLVTPRISSNLWRHLRCCPRKPQTKTGGNEEQGRLIHDQNYNVVSSESNSDREGLRNNTHLKKRQRSSSAMLLGLDVLDCPICFEALTIPIFQCENGHLACTSCCPKLSNKCPSCASPVGHNRCRAMESVLESVFVPCRNAKFGCTKIVSYAKESIHEKECTFTQCSCPALECSYTGSYDNIYTHFVDNHCHESKSVSFVCGSAVDVQMNIASEKSLVLWESKKRLLFALQCFNEPDGLYVTVRWIAPSAPELGKLAYCLYYSMDGHTLTYKSPEVKRVLEVSSETPQDNFMFVPHSLLRGESLEMKITIGLKVSASS
ncbi:PREDICTED: E3 ubiquitin-protein ligase SINA-like 7 [Camelina sativa]|uniref:RING-type E3 ubiquitin transferase n=1 Tax=Camelina sativa TaxID=90675 RepID=A0ABM1QL38_CAMSA|nr:PREDICTED: E3 ubiquitin-protein ligase SINA-like 7 [Camelina sativa]